MNRLHRVAGRSSTRNSASLTDLVVVQVAIVVDPRITRRRFVMLRRPRGARPLHRVPGLDRRTAGPGCRAPVARHGEVEPLFHLVFPLEVVEEESSLDGGRRSPRPPRRRVLLRCRSGIWGFRRTGVSVVWNQATPPGTRTPSDGGWSMTSSTSRNGPDDVAVSRARVAEALVDILRPRQAVPAEKHRTCTGPSVCRCPRRNIAPRSRPGTKKSEATAREVIWSLLSETSSWRPKGTLNWPMRARAADVGARSRYQSRSLTRPAVLVLDALARR